MIPGPAFFFDQEARRALEGFYGIKIRSVHPFPNHTHSVNARVVTEYGLEVVVKAVHESNAHFLEILLRHLSAIKSPVAVKALFGGRCLEHGGWRVIALEYIRGRSIMPEDYSSGTIGNLIEAYRNFSGGLTDDGAILPERNLLELRDAVLEAAGRQGCRRILEEVSRMDESSLTYPSVARRIIHGDLHYKNFKFLDGKVSGFIDVEELRYGTPAEDFVRNIVCRNEHLRLYKRRASRRLLAVFAEIVRRTGITREEWLFAINGYLLTKLQKKLQQPHSPLKDWILSRRFPFYRRLRTIVKNLKPRIREDGRVVVKIFGASSISRFVGKDGLLWAGKYFFTSDAACRDYDWLCVYDEIPGGWPELKRGRIRPECPRNRTMLITQEPTSVKFYNSMYVRQFAVLLTNRPRCAENHPGYVKGEGYMVWYTGRSFAEEAGRTLPEKTRLISAIYSSKKMRHTAHGSRFALLSSLKENLPGFDWFGKGVNPIALKSDALDDYKYTLAAENHIAEGHWSEKLSDAIVSGCLPFYAGDPSIGKLLPEGAIVTVPIDDPPEAYRIIKEAIAGGEWECRRDAILQARELMFSRYNLFAQVAKAIESGCAVDPKGVVWDEPVLMKRKQTRFYPAPAAQDMLNHAKKLLRSFGMGRERRGV